MIKYFIYLWLFIVLLVINNPVAADDKAKIFAENQVFNKWVKSSELEETSNEPLIYCPSTKNFILLRNKNSISEFNLKSRNWVDKKILGKPTADLVRAIYFQATWNADSSHILFYQHNKTFMLDPKTYLLTDLGISPSPGENNNSLLKPGQLGTYCGDHSQVIWGSLCFDPINKEVLSLGGASSDKEGTPGFWTFRLTDKKWIKITPDLNGKKQDAFNKINKSYEQLWNLLSYVRNRYFATETMAENKTDLHQMLAQILDEIKELKKETSASFAKDKMDQCLNLLADVNLKANNPIDIEIINKLSKAYQSLHNVVNLYREFPAARLNSQMVFDPIQKKVFLFGGDGWDCLYNDTWAYDCSTKRWEQLLPKKSPSPRAGHAMVYLPKSKKIVMVGGYAYGHASWGYYKSLSEMWVYDTILNEWNLLIHNKPISESEHHNSYIFEEGTPVVAPVLGYQKVVVWPVAANEEDTLVLIDAGNILPNKTKCVTWICQVDTSKIINANELLTDTSTAAYRQWTSKWDAAAKPEEGRIDKAIKNLKTNTWTKVRTPLDTFIRDWGTMVYDTLRHQVLYWGGGHSSYLGSDLHQYSIKSGAWSESYDPDINLDYAVGFNAPGLLTFKGRPQIPVHAYKSYGFDPASSLMVNCHFGFTYTYDVGKRKWIGDPIKTPFNADVMLTGMASSENNLVVWSDLGFFQFDGDKRTWNKLPLKTVDLPTPYGDSSGICWDSKRKVFWFGFSAADIRSYNPITGEVSSKFSCPSSLNIRKDFGVCIREMIYIPDQDILFFMTPRKINGKNSNYCLDPNTGKWFCLDMPYLVDGKEVSMECEDLNQDWWTASMKYDSLNKLIVLFRQYGDGRVWLLKLEKTNFVEIKP